MGRKFKFPFTRWLLFYQLFILKILTQRENVPIPVTLVYRKRITKKKQKTNPLTYLANLVSEPTHGHEFVSFSPYPYPFPTAYRIWVRLFLSPFYAVQSFSSSPFWWHAPASILSTFPIWTVKTSVYALEHSLWASVPLRRWTIQPMAEEKKQRISLVSVHAVNGM